MEADLDTSDLDHEAYLHRIDEISQEREGDKESSTADNIKVSVRIRPLNERELRLKSQIVTKAQSRDGCELVLTNPSAGNKANRFRFDNVFDSHNKKSERYINQRTVFESIGLGICESAVSGFNTSLFAYGQTGSGKTYSMTGSKLDRGIIPRICDMIFYIHRTQTKTEKDLDIEVTASYLEIYNERCRDLLRPDTNELKLRDSPEKGPFVQGLTWLACSTSKDIEALMEEGLLNRTTAATNMNAQSSRSHSIFSIYLSQKRREVVGNVMSETNKHSKVALIDLAGSESSKSTGSTGAQLVESSNINRSLSCLGRCISELVKLANFSAKDKTSHVPYRDSTLTWLLRDCLGGNSKTNLLVAISPAEANYAESMSTLRFAQQCKMIKTKAIVNEDHMTRLVADLKAEVERLKDELKQQTIGSGQGSLDTGSPSSSFQANDSALSVMEIWEELKKKRAKDEMRKLREKRKKHNKVLGAEGANMFTPYLTNITADPMTTGTLKIFLLKDQPLVVGAPKHHLNTPSSIGLEDGEEDMLFENHDDELPPRQLNEGKTSRSFRQGIAAASSFNQSTNTSPPSTPTSRNGSHHQIKNLKNGKRLSQQMQHYKLPNYIRDLDLNGLGMEPEHVRFHHTTDDLENNMNQGKRELDQTSFDDTNFDPNNVILPTVTVETCVAGADTYVNGQKITVPGPEGSRVLKDGDRVVLGVCSQMFVFRQPTIESVMSFRKDQPNSTNRKLARTGSTDLDQEGLTVLKDYSYDRCVKEVILNRDESTLQRHERYARMCQSILRRKTFSRAFETNLVRALQQVQTANALASLFAGDEIWFEIHFAGGLGGGAGGWGQQLFSLSAHDVLRPEAKIQNQLFTACCCVQRRVVSVEVKCYFRSSGWLTDKTVQSDAYQEPGSPLSLDIEDDNTEATSSYFPVLSPSQCRPISLLLSELGLNLTLQQSFHSAKVYTIGDLRFVSDSELQMQGISLSDIQSMRAHRLLTIPVNESKNTRGVVDKLWTASPEELRRLFIAFEQLDTTKSKVLGFDEIRSAVRKVTGKILSDNNIKTFIIRLNTSTTSPRAPLTPKLSHGNNRKLRNSHQFSPPPQPISSPRNLKTTKESNGYRSRSPRPSQQQHRGQTIPRTPPTRSAKPSSLSSQQRNSPQEKMFFHNNNQPLPSGAVESVAGSDVNFDHDEFLSFNCFARALLRNRGVLKMDSKGLVVNGAASLVALMEQSQRRKILSSPNTTASPSQPPARRPSNLGRSVSNPMSNGFMCEPKEQLKSMNSYQNVLTSKTSVSDLLASPTDQSPQQFQRLTEKALQSLSLDDSDEIQSKNNSRNKNKTLQQFNFNQTNNHSNSRSRGRDPRYHHHYESEDDEVGGGYDDIENEEYQSEENQSDIYIDESNIKDLLKKRKQALMIGDVDRAALLTQELKILGHGIIMRTSSTASLSTTDSCRMSSSCQDPTALQLFECSADSFDLFVDSLRLVAVRVDPLLSAIRKLDDWLRGLENHFDMSDSEEEAWTLGLSDFLETSNKEGIDFLDCLFDDLDRSHKEVLDKDDICQFLLERLHIKDVMTASELNVIYHDFFHEFDKYRQEEFIDEHGGSCKDQLLNRLAFHSFIRFILHYLFLLAITDLGDDPQFMFSHMEQLVQFARGRGGSNYLTKRFSSTQSLSQNEFELIKIKENDLKKEKNLNELKIQIEQLEKLRKNDEKMVKKEKERLLQVTKTLKLNDAKNRMLEKELERVRGVLSGTKQKKNDLENDLNKLKNDEKIKEEERRKEKEKEFIENKIRKEYEEKKDEERQQELIRKEDQLKILLLNHQITTNKQNEENDFISKNENLNKDDNEEIINLMNNSIKKKNFKQRKEEDSFKNKNKSKNSKNKQNDNSNNFDDGDDITEEEEEEGGGGLGTLLGVGTVLGDFGGTFDFGSYF